MDYKIMCGQALENLRKMPSESVQTCVTSPPYFRLRDYGVQGQIGLEETLEEYLLKLTDIFRELRRVLRQDGTLWLNIGDTYANSGRNNGTDKIDYKQATNSSSWGISNKVKGFKTKDLMLVPAKVAEALRIDGWYLRQDIIWAKPNPMPESVKDRCTKSYEHLFLLSKSQRYYFDAKAIAEPAAESSIKRLAQNIEKQKGSDRVPGKSNGTMKAVMPRFCGKKYTENPNEFYRTKSGEMYDFRPKRNKRDVWIIPTHPYRAAHFATFPEKLVEPCILAGSREGDHVLDPFCGSGTTGVVALKLKRNFIGIDINSKYCDMAELRIKKMEH